MKIVATTWKAVREQRTQTMKAGANELVVRHLGVKALQSQFAQWPMEQKERLILPTSVMTKRSMNFGWCSIPRYLPRGRRARPNICLPTGDIPVVQVDRGGQVTYHGPGQQVIYLLLNIRRKGIGVRELVSDIEQSIIDTLARTGHLRQGPCRCPRRLCWRCQNRRSRTDGFGEAAPFTASPLNIDMDLTPFQRINPCGYAKWRWRRCRICRTPRHHHDLRAPCRQPGKAYGLHRYML